jgi:hypothetical protein
MTQPRDVAPARFENETKCVESLRAFDSSGSFLPLAPTQFA